MFLSSWRENDAFSRAGRRAPIVLYDNIVPFEETIRTVVSTAKSGGVDGDATPDLAESIGNFPSVSRREAYLRGRECYIWIEESKTSPTVSKSCSSDIGRYFGIISRRQFFNSTTRMLLGLCVSFHWKCSHSTGGGFIGFSFTRGLRKQLVSDLRLG